MDDFEGWYLSEHGRVAGVCAALSGDADLAAEAADEAFARALMRWESVSAMDRPEAWVLTVALNHLRRTTRRRSMERSLLRRQHRPVVEPSLPEPELWAAVRELPPRQRTAIVLRYVGDLAEADVARVMGVARGTVASSLSAARAALAERLGAGERMEESHHG